MSASRIASRAALISIAVAAVLATTKITIGLMAGSVAVVSDGFESAADLITSALVWFGLWIASKPADANHPYGHGRFETLTALAVGIILLAVGAGICWHSFERRNDVHMPALFAIWPVIASLGIKGTLATWKMRVGKKTGSTALTADAMHDVVDLLSGAVALSAVLLAVFAPGGGMHAADHYGAVIIGVLVIFMGVRVIRETVFQLVDTMPDTRQMQEIRAAALRVQGALAVEKCFARKTGLRYHVDLHLEVDPNLSVLESHEIARNVKAAIKADVDWVEDVLVHVEPHLAEGRQPLHVVHHQ
jgi:cation diffusion facilitator family transporter